MHDDIPLPVTVADLSTREQVILLRALFPCLTGSDVARWLKVSRQRVSQLMQEHQDLRNEEVWLLTTTPKGCRERYQDEQAVFTLLQEGEVGGQEALEALLTKPSVQRRLESAKSKIAAWRAAQAQE